MDGQPRGRGRHGQSRGNSGRGRGGGRGGHGARTSSTATPPTAPAEGASGNAYIVIISNVENDLAKVHHDQLPPFLSLNTKREGRESLDNVEQATGKSGSEKQCYYELVCRSETRSAELKVFGEADASVSSVFNAKTLPARTASANGNDSAGRPTAADPSNSSNGTGDDKESLKVSVSLDSAPSAVSHQYAFHSLEDMAALLSGKPYFTRRLGFHVSIPGKTEGEALSLSADALRRLSCRQPDRGDAGQRGGRREREGEDEKSLAAKKRARKETANAATEAEVEEAEDGSDKGKPAVDSARPEATRSDAAVAPWQRLKHTTFHQKDLVTVMAVVSSAQWTAGKLQYHLRDLPGFLACWRLHAKHFRVLFQHRDYLFKAKQLLDQFHLDGNVRVTLQPSDTLTRLYTAYVAKEEAAADASA